MIGITSAGLFAQEKPVGLIDSRPLAAHSKPAGATMFTEMPASATGIATENNYADMSAGSGAYRDPRMWGDRYHEFEVGSVGTGVAIGDYDGDGRPDIFVVSKTESCRLFRNLGECKFEDVTEKAGVGDHGDAAKIWKQGATFADVNNDGRLDLYICRFGAPNLLYINGGDGTFKEEAAVRGLAISDASVMAVFCDYDRDGWLDVYLQTNLLNGVQHPAGQRDHLFHNSGDGTFTDVSDRAGIRGETQGHSATWWDFDEDGWPDLYVANDFGPEDNLYRNNHDGTFTDMIDRVVPHQPYSSMGSDLGDVNNDGHIDFFVADMAATTHQKDQRTMAPVRSTLVELPEGSPNAPQFMRNALYLNTGVGRMLEAAELSGIAATDWTWSVRFEDLDNDGRLDLFVTNGMHREVHNADQIQRLLKAETVAEKLRLEFATPVLNEPHLAYRNCGDLQFEEVGAAWGLGARGVSFGAAFGDLDGDGDLDLVYTNYRKGVTVLRNDSMTGHRVIFALRGSRSNRFGVGATVRIATEKGVQVRQLVLARGVLSNSEPVLHFGLGDASQIDDVTIEWPSGEIQSFDHLAADRKYFIAEPARDEERKSAGIKPAQPTSLKVPPQFEETAARLHLDLVAREDVVDELAQQPLLPWRLNRRGPFVAIGDLDGDGHNDLIFGGTRQDPARVIVHGEMVSLEGAGVAVDDGPIALFDANGDDALDVLLTRGGSSAPAGSPDYQPKLWLNDGHGRLQPAPSDALPPLSISAGAAVAADFDRDGTIDLFVAARLVPGGYPARPHSALLRNRSGRFEDVTDSVAPFLGSVGMVTAAMWSDLDGDGWPDLVIATDWATVKCFHNEKGRAFTDWTERAGFAAAGKGWWRSLATADFNRDGRPDFVVGNVGLNTPYRADPQHPALLFVGDFRGDGSEQLVEGYFEGEKLYPRRTRKELGAVIPAVLKRFLKNDAFAQATLEEVVGRESLNAADRFEATELRSGVFLSQPDGRYRFEPLPRIAQIAPIEGLVAGDFDGDGDADIYAVQNSFGPIPSVGRFDGGLSQLLRGDGHGHFIPVPVAESGLVVPGDAKSVAVFDAGGDGRPDFFVTRNNDTALVFLNRMKVHDKDGRPLLRNDTPVTDASERRPYR